MSDPRQPAPKIEQEKDYLRRVRKQVEALDAYAPRQMLWHRVSRTIVIVSGAAVPVLASWSAAPRPVLALFGGIAAAAEGIAQLLQFQSKAANAMKTHNEMERELNLFLFSAGPYVVHRSFWQFVERIEEIRAATDQAFLATLQKDHSPPAIEQTDASHAG